MSTEALHPTLLSSYGTGWITSPANTRWSVDHRARSGRRRRRWRHGDRRALNAQRAAEGARTSAAMMALFSFSSRRRDAGRPREHQVCVGHMREPAGLQESARNRFLAFDSGASLPSSGGFRIVGNHRRIEGAVAGAADLPAPRRGPEPPAVARDGRVAGGRRERSGGGAPARDGTARGGGCSRAQGRHARCPDSCRLAGHLRRKPACAAATLPRGAELRASAASAVAAALRPSARRCSSASRRGQLGEALAGLECCHLEHGRLEMDQRLRAVAHRPRHIGDQAEPTEQIVLGPALALRAQALALVPARPRPDPRSGSTLRISSGGCARPVPRPARADPCLCRTRRCSARSGGGWIATYDRLRHAKNASRSAMPSTRRTLLVVHVGLARRDTLSRALTASRIDLSLGAISRPRPRRALNFHASDPRLARANLLNRSATRRSGTRAKSKSLAARADGIGQLCGSVVAKMNTRCCGGSSAS